MLCLPIFILAICGLSLGLLPQNRARKLAVSTGPASLRHQVRRLFRSAVQVIRPISANPSVVDPLAPEREPGSPFQIVAPIPAPTAPVNNATVSAVRAPEAEPWVASYRAAGPASVRSPTRHQIRRLTRRQMTREQVLVRCRIRDAFTDVKRRFSRTSELELTLGLSKHINRKWKIHGLWPSCKVNGTGRQQNDRALWTNTTHLSTISPQFPRRLGSTLYKNMSKYWPSKYGKRSNHKFWEHEWLKHGTVIFGPKLTRRTDKQSIKSWESRKMHFGETIKLYRKIKDDIQPYCNYEERRNTCNLCPYRRNFLGYERCPEPATPVVRAATPVPTVTLIKRQEAQIARRPPRGWTQHPHLEQKMDLKPSSGNTRGRRRRLATYLLRAKKQTCDTLTEKLQANYCEAASVEAQHRGCDLSESLTLNTKLAFVSKDLREAQEDANLMRDDIRNEIERRLGNSVSVSRLDPFEVMPIFADTVRVVLKGPISAAGVLERVMTEIDGCGSESFQNMTKAGIMTHCHAEEVVANFDNVSVLRTSITFGSGALLNAELYNVKKTIAQIIAKHSSAVVIDDFYAVVCNDTRVDDVIFDKYRPIETRLACMDLASELQKPFVNIPGAIPDHAAHGMPDRCVMTDSGTLFFGPAANRAASTFACAKITQKKCETVAQNLCVGLVDGLHASYWTPFKHEVSQTHSWYIDQILRRTCKSKSCFYRSDKYWCCDQKLGLKSALPFEDTPYLDNSVGVGYRVLDNTSRFSVLNVRKGDNLLNGVTITKVHTCEMSSTLVERSSNARQSERLGLLNEFSLDLSLEASVDILFFQSSIRAESAVQKSKKEAKFIESSTSMDTRVVEVRQDCVTAEVKIRSKERPLFTQYFLTQLSKMQVLLLKSELEQEIAFKQFVDEFGLHIITTAKFGGLEREYETERASEVENIKEEAENKCAKKSTSVSASAGVIETIISGNVKGGYSEDANRCVENEVNKELRQKFRLLSERKRTVGMCSCDGGGGGEGGVKVQIELQALLPFLKQEWLSQSIWFGIYTPLDATAINQFFKRWVWLEVGNDTCFIVDYRLFSGQEAEDARRGCLENSDPANCKLSMCNNRLTNRRRINHACDHTSCLNFCCLPEEVAVDGDCGGDPSVLICESGLGCWKKNNLTAECDPASDDVGDCTCKPYANLDCTDRLLGTESEACKNKCTPANAVCQGLDGTGVCDGTSTCEKIHIINKDADTCTVRNPCNQCEGDCDRDEECKGSLKCYQRDGNTQLVHGCSNRNRNIQPNYDYCYAPGHIFNKGADACTVSNPCNQCEGDCDRDEDCKGSLKCYQRNRNTQLVYGCSSWGLLNTDDYCYAPGHIVNKGADACTVNNPCNQCEGDCDRDEDCEGSLKCYQRNNSTELVYGCSGWGLLSDDDYCFAPVDCKDRRLGSESETCESKCTPADTLCQGLDGTGVCDGTSTCKKIDCKDRPLGFESISCESKCIQAGAVCQGSDGTGVCDGASTCKKVDCRDRPLGTESEACESKCTPADAACQGLDGTGVCDGTSTCKKIDCGDRPLGTRSDTCESKCTPVDAVCQGLDGTGVCDGTSTCKKIDCKDQPLGTESETCENECTPVDAICQGLDGTGTCDGTSTCKKIQIINKGADACTRRNPCNQCEGDCDSDDDCKGALRCYQRNGTTQLVYGCFGGVLLDRYDYCYAPVQIINKGADGCTANNPCNQCEGDCDSDEDCEGLLKCYEREGNTQLVYGCSGAGLLGNHNYCYAPDKRCPASNPYAFLQGSYCCKHNKEKHHQPDGSLCDGSEIAIHSNCCYNDEHVPCPNPPCRTHVLCPALGCIQNWKYNGREQMACSNPDNDPNGSWCPTSLEYGEYVVGSEAFKYCASCACATQQLTCGDGRCVPLSFMCDGDNDCGDWSDEADCKCEDDDAGLQTEPDWDNYVCTYDHFYCSSYTKIMRKHCSKFCGFCTCTTHQFTCGNGRCVPAGYMCDGDNDCGDRSDEADCTRTTHQFTCGNGRRVPARYMCDGDNDCGDRSDEADCTCATHQFTCGNGRCVPAGYMCDGDNDCGDRSDEADCN